MDTLGALRRLPSKEKIKAAKLLLAIYTTECPLDNAICTILSALSSAESRLEIAERERDEARLRLSQHHGPGNAWHTDAPGDLHCRVCGIAYSAAVSGPASTSTDRVVGDG